MSRLPKLLALAVLALAPAACSAAADSEAPPAHQTDKDLDWDTPHPIKLHEDAVLAPAAVSDVAVLNADTIEIPAGAAVQGWIGTLAVGKVIAGDRSSKSLDASTNVTGFLRRVTSITKNGDTTVIGTTPAHLDELIEDGDLVFDPEHGTGSIFASLGAANGSGVRIRANGDANGTPSSGQGTAPLEGQMKWVGDEAKAGLYASFSNGKVSVGAQYKGELKLRKFFGIPYGVKHASAKLTLTPIVSVDYELGYKVSGGATQKPIGADGKVEAPSAPIPLGGPIPLTLRIVPAVGCHVGVTGQIGVRGTAALRGNVAAGFAYDGGLDLQNTSESPTLTPEWKVNDIFGKASLTAECGPSVKFELLAFDAVGITGSFGFYGDVTAELCSSVDPVSHVETDGFDAFVSYGPRVDVGGRLQVPGLGEPSISKDIFSWKPFELGPFYVVGDANTCKVKQKDSCVGKQDGLYCSELVTASAYQCKGGQISGGQQCATGLKCASAAGTSGPIVCK